MSEKTKSNIPVKKYTQIKDHHFPYSIFRFVFQIIDNKNNPYYLSKGVNTSAEWIKKGQKKNLVKDMSRAAGSVSATRAEQQYGEQWNFDCHQPVIDIQSPGQLACRNMQFTLSINQMAIT